MIRGEVELIADTMLIDKMSMIEYAIQKQAGFADTLLGMTGSGFSAISNAAAAEVEQAKGEPVTAVTRMIMSGMLTTVWWPLGIINTIAKDTFNIDLLDLMKIMWEKALDIIQDKGSITSAELSQIARAETSKLASSLTNEKIIYGDLFEPLKIAAENDKLYRLMSTAGAQDAIGSVWDFLSKLPQTKGRSVMGAFAGWALRAAVIGAGLTMVSGTATRLLGINKEEPVSETPKDVVEIEEPGNTTIPAIKQEGQKSTLTPTGRGQDRHANDHKSSKWIVPLVNNSVDDTLIAWAGDIYKELVDQDDAITDSNSFNRVVNELENGLDWNNRTKVVIPSKYKSRKQVVDQFAMEAAQNIKGTSNV